MPKTKPLFSWNIELEKRYASLRDQKTKWDSYQQSEVRRLLVLRDIWLESKIIDEGN